MAARHYHVKDPAFSEYLFHVMRLSSPEERSNLDKGELQYFVDEKAIRRFAENDTLDKQLLLMTRLGYSFAVVVAPIGADVDGVTKRVTSQYRARESRLEIVNAMNEQRIFVMSSRETMVLAHMMAQNTHSEVFTLDYKYPLLHDKLNEYRIRPFAQEVKDGATSMDFMAKVALAALVGEDVVPALTGCTNFQIGILLALYQHRTTLVGNNVLAQKVGETKRARGVAKACAELEKRGYVLREPGHRGNSKSLLYMISDSGINAVLNYIKYIIKQMD